MSNTTLPQPWADKKPDPSNQVLNPFVPDKDPCMTVLFQHTPKGKNEKTDTKILNKYHNVRYSGAGDKSNALLTQKVKNAQFQKRAMRSRFWTKLNDGESKNKKAVEIITEANPRFLTDKANEASLDKELNESYTLAKDVMTATGQATFVYTPDKLNQVDLVKGSVQAYTNYRDRFFIAPVAGQTANVEKPKTVDSTNSKAIDRIQKELLGGRTLVRNRTAKKTV